MEFSKCTASKYPILKWQSFFEKENSSLWIMPSRKLLLKISGNIFFCLLLAAVLDDCINNCWNACQIPQNSKIISKANSHLE